MIFRYIKAAAPAIIREFGEFIRGLVLHKHVWVSKVTHKLFFLGKLRKTVTFYLECAVCGEIRED